MIVFDDLHWADSESVALFERLAEPGSGPRLLVGTYRPDALHRRHPTAEMLPRLERRHAVTHLHLERLSAPEVGSFLAGVYGHEPSYRVVEALHARTGGNPFFLEELLAAAREDDPEELLSQELPWSLAELVRTQLERPRQRRAARARDRRRARRHPRRLRPARGGVRKHRRRAHPDPAPPRRPRSAGRSGARRLLVPPRARARSDRDRSARTRTPAPASRGARRVARDRTATTSPRSRITPAARASSTTWSRRRARARCGRCTRARPTRRSSSPSSV